MSSLRRIVLVPIVLLLPCLVLPAGAARGAVDLVPHRAVYDLSLAAARGSGSVTDVDGRIAFTWKDVCDGWTIDYRTRLQMFFGRRGGQDVSWRYSAWERDDGLRFRYFLRRFREGSLTEKLRGSARLRPDGGGVAEIEAPEPQRVELPADTLFPKAHTEKLLEAAQAGRQFLFAHVFDGTGEQGGLYAVNAVILEPGPEGPEVDSPLMAEVPSWRINLAFFPAEGADGTPESEQSMRVYANGIAGSMRIDYGDFVVDARLTELEPLGRPQCR